MQHANIYANQKNQPNIQNQQMQGGIPMQQQSQQQQQQGKSPQNSSQKSLWIGDVLPYMTEKDIAMQFHGIAEVVNVKLIKDKQTNKPVGYGFVEFQDYDTARDVFTTLNGKKIPGQENRYFKLNWASHGGGVARAYNNGPVPYQQPGYNQNNNMRSNNNHMTQQQQPMSVYGGGGGALPQGQPEAFQVYVGDLDPSVSNHNLLQFFKQIYHSVCEAKVIVDPVSRKSKGYGFIKFFSKEESERALQEMNGKQFYGRAIKMNYASQRIRQNDQGMNNRYGNMQQTQPVSQHMHGAQGHQHQGQFGNQPYMQGPNAMPNHNQYVDPMMDMQQPGLGKINQNGFVDPVMDNIYPNLNPPGLGQGQRSMYGQVQNLPHGSMPSQMPNDRMMQNQFKQPNNVGLLQGSYGQHPMHQLPHQQQPSQQQMGSLSTAPNMSPHYPMHQAPANQQQSRQQQQYGNNMHPGAIPNQMGGVAGNMPVRGRHTPSQPQDSHQYNNNLSNLYGTNQSSMGANMIPKNEPNMQEEHNIYNGQQQMNQKLGNDDLAANTFNQLNHKLNDNININTGLDSKNNAPFETQASDPSNLDQINRMIDHSKIGHDALNMGNIGVQNQINNQNPADASQLIGQFASQNPEMPQQNGQSRVNNYQVKSNIVDTNQNIIGQQMVSQNEEGKVVGIAASEQQHAMLGREASINNVREQQSGAQLQKIDQNIGNYLDQHSAALIGNGPQTYQTHPNLAYGQVGSTSNLGNCVVPALMNRKLAIEPISVEEICAMNKEFLEPIINNSELLYIL